MAAPLDAEAQAARETQRQAQCAQRWIAELGVSEKAQRKWLERARKIARRYRDEDLTDNDKRPRRFAMLWSNTQTIQPAVYSRPPNAVVGRRFKDADPVGRVASEVLERCLTYSIDKQDLDGVLRACSFDYVLLARGQTWERYVPTHGPQVIPQIDLQPITEGSDAYEDADGKPYEGAVSFGDDGQPYGQGEAYEPVVFEESITDYVNWEDFGHSVSRTWDEVGYVWRRVYLSRRQLIARFGEEVGNRVPLDWGPRNGPKDPEISDLGRKAAVYEIWCKDDKKAYWISKAFPAQPLDERDDPLELDGFFPCPRPLLGTTANESTIPTPDYVFYQDQAQEIDKLTAHIGVLQDAVKVRGFYAGEKTNDLNNLLNSDTNTLIPVPDWVSMKESGGVKGNIDWFPIEQVVQALNALIVQRQQLINDVYQITGVADILRGQSDPSETATAQGIKAQWGSIRIRDRQIEMMRFARDILRIKGEVIAGKFSADTLRQMTGVQLPTAAEKQQALFQIQQAQVLAQQAQMAPQGPPGTPPQAMMGHNGGPPMPAIPDEVQQMLNSPTWEDVEALLQNETTRGFRIDIETDSTIEPNEQEEKQRTTEFMTAMGQFISLWGPAVTAQPLLAPMAGAFIKYGARRFRAGRELEDVIDTTIDQITAQAGQQGPPGAQTKPADQTPVQVATVNQQTEQITQAGETQRTQIEAQIAAEELRLKEDEQRLKATEQQIKLATLGGVQAPGYPQ